jgi:hypothetical protein
MVCGRSTSGSLQRGGKEFMAIRGVNRASRQHRVRCVLGRVCAAVALAIALSGCGRKELSERPDRVAVANALTARPSAIAALGTVPVAKLKAIVNDKVPASFDAGGNGQDVCVSIKVLGLSKDVCAGTKYELKVVRTGEVQVSAAGPSTLRLTVPISFSGKGGLRGNLASLLKLDAKNFDGALVAHADLAVSIDEGWCPRLDASIGYDWTSNPRVEIVERVNVDVKGAVQSKIDEKLPELVAAAKNAIDCAKFKDEIAKVYASRTLPVDVPHAGVMHLNVLPIDMGFSTLRVQPDAVKLAAVMTANVDLSDKALTPQQLPLPRLKTVEATVPRMTIAVPVRMPYDALTAALRTALMAQPFAADTAAGKVLVTVKDVEVYPSNGKVAVGLSIDAELPVSFLGVKGKIYVTGTPSVEAGTRISFPDAAFTQSLDNAFWSVASSAFEGPLRAALRKAAVYDVGPEIAKAKQALADKLRDPSLAPGISVSVENVDIGVGRVAVADAELAVEGLVSADVTVSANP